MKNLKRALTILIALCMVLSLSVIVHGQTATNTQAIYDDTTSTITITGTNPYGQNVVSVTVNRLIIDPITEAVTDRSMCYYNFTTSEADGSFEFEFEFNGDVHTTAKYEVIAGGAGLDNTEVSGSPVIYVHPDATDDFLDAVEGSNKDTIEGIIRANKLILDIDLSTYHIKDVTDKAKVYDAISGRRYSGIESFKSTFYEAVAVQRFNESAQSGAEGLLSEYGSALGVSLTGRYDDVASKQSVHSAICGKSIPLLKSEFAKKFDSAVYTALCNEVNTKNREKLMEYINECNAASNPNLVTISLADYNSTLLTDKDRLDIVKNVIDAKDKTAFETLDDVKTVFEREASLMLSSKTNNDDDNDDYEYSGDVTTNISIGGGGGGGGGKTETKPAVPQTPEGEKTTFTDIENVSWAKDGIEYLASKNILQGVGNGKFEPERSIKREEFVKLIVEAFEIEDNGTAKAFADTDKSAWYYSYIKKAVASGIITGIDDNFFGVGQDVTREQMCAIVYRTMNLLGINIEEKNAPMEFKDKADISGYATEAINAMSSYGIVNGMEDGSFSPKAETTRAMAAKVIYTFIERSGLK